MYTAFIAAFTSEKGISRDGGRADFSTKKNTAPISLMKTYRMSLTLEGSNSLDSTFKQTYHSFFTQSNIAFRDLEEETRTNSRDIGNLQESLVRVLTARDIKDKINRV
jgi:hypothetical protein